MKFRALILVLIALAAGLGYFFLKKNPATNLGKLAYEQTKQILAFGPRPPGSPALKNVKQHLIQELSKSCWEIREVNFSADTPEGEVQFSNLIARYRKSSDTWNRPVKGIICAHIDSKLMKDQVFLGADDSASACAAITEIAKHLSKKSPQLAEQMELVFFDGEEALGKHMNYQDGLYGSRHYAGQWRKQENKPKFGLVLDMIGHRDLDVLLPSDSPEALKNALLGAAKKHQVSQHFAVGVLPVMDDHVPLNFSGIPTLDIIGNFSKFPWWHQTGDTIEQISPESLDISIKIVLEILQQLAF